MSTFSAYKTDPELESNGFWHYAEDGSKWKLRSFNSRRARDAYDIARAPYAGMLQRFQQSNKQIPQEIDEKITLNILMGGVIVACEYTNENDEICTFDKTLVKTHLEQLKYLAAELFRAASDFHNYLAASKVEDVKNSDAPSSTSLNGGERSTSSPAASTMENQPQT